MSISVINIDETEKWDSIVKSFKDYDVYYLNGYVKAFQIHGDGEPMLVYFTGERTRAINVIMKRDISEDAFFQSVIGRNTYYDTATPYGYGGFLVEGDEIDLLDEEYTAYCSENNIVCEFDRFHPILNNNKKVASIYSQTHLGDTVALQLNSKEEIWQNITSKNRNMIRKAKSAGLEVFWGRDDMLVEEFCKIYNATMDNANASKYYYFEKEFYESVITDLKNNAMFFYTKYNGQIIAISIIMFCNRQMHYHLSASLKQFQKLAPTNLLLYEAACYGSDNGYTSFHLGGGLGAGHDSLYAFKKSFNRQEDKNFFIGKKIFNQEVYDKLVLLRQQSGFASEKSDNFFPAYRR